MFAIGIMQGRLVPPVHGIQAFPRDCWKQEFINAREASLGFIEWIFDSYGFDFNPILSESGIKELLSLIHSTQVRVDSICADYFMDNPLLKGSPTDRKAREQILSDLLRNGKKIGVLRVVLPFVDASNIQSDEEAADFVHLMQRILPLAEELKIELHMETSLPPRSVVAILDRLKHPLFWINYDSGNSASLGYKPEREFQAYGKRIGSFHVKDRVLNGSTTALGSGDTDFVSLARCLHDYNYQGPFTLQVARGESGKEIEWAKTNVLFTKKHLLRE